MRFGLLFVLVLLGISAFTPRSYDRERPVRKKLTKGELMIPDQSRTRFLKAVSVLLDVFETGELVEQAGGDGATKWGITKRSYPDINIADLTREQALDIYWRDWWLKEGYNELPPILGEQTFFAAVNVGPRPAVMILQRAIRATGKDHVIDDGVLGSITKAAVGRSDPAMVSIAFRSEQAGYYRELVSNHPPHRTYLNGWLWRAYFRWELPSEA